MIERNFDINEDGYSIKCKIYCNDIRNIKEAVIYTHGFGGSKDNKATFRFAERMISKHKYTAVICFDLPSHGDDVRKRISLKDCDLYLDKVIQYAKNHFKANKLYAYANSLGAYLTLNYLDHHGNPFTKIVLRSPALNMYQSLMGSIEEHELMDDYLKGKDVNINPENKITINKDFVEELKENDVMEREYLDYADDILLIQGTKDEVISMDKVKEFSENNVIECIYVENADHRFRDSNLLDYAISEIIKFMDSKN